MNDFEKANAIFQSLSVQELDQLAELQKTMDPKDLQRAISVARSGLAAIGRQGPFSLNWENVVTIMLLSKEQQRELVPFEHVERLLASVRRAYPWLESERKRNDEWAIEGD